MAAPVEIEEQQTDYLEGLDKDMATEPALTIGKIFANKVLLKAIITAFIALFAKLLNLSTGDDTVDVWTDAVFYIGIIASPLIAQWEARKKAMEQAEQTREKVFAPVTVQRIADANYIAGLPPVEPQPPVPMPEEAIE